jgi:hypothetical protein
MSAAEFVNRGVMSRVSAVAEVCTNHAPGAKADWERALEGMSEKVDRLTREVLDMAPFVGLDKESIPSAGAAELLKAIETSKSDLKAQLEKDNPDANCPQMLKNILGVSDEFLRAGVTQGLAGVQTMLIALKSGYIK